MMRLPLALCALALFLTAQKADARFDGPGRFCGYSVVLDLQRGENIEAMSLGIHSGNFVWSGSFGRLEVSNVGWARKPEGVLEGTRKGLTTFRIERAGREGLALWNGRAGAAYFFGSGRITAEQRAAIDRVYLIDELSDEPQGCRYRTIFSWN